MSNDFAISKCTRRCAVSGRGLEPGEAFVSVLLPRGDEVVRLDIADSEWKGPQPETIGWWKSRMPDAATRKLRPAPNGVLLDALSGLLERPGKEALAYLLSLLLVRRRVLAEEEILEIHEADDCQSDTWNLVSPVDGREWSVPIVAIDPASIAELQEELNTLLFTEG